MRSTLVFTQRTRNYSTGSLCMYSLARPHRKDLDSLQCAWADWPGG